MKFNLKYFSATIFIFLIEVLIATKLKNQFFIRAYLGDVIVVLLIYSFVLSFFEIKSKTILLAGIFIFSCIIEFAQYLGITEMLRLKPGSIAHIVVGSSFSWWDILCYFAGCFILLLFIKIKKNLLKN